MLFVLEISTKKLQLDPYWTYELCHGLHIRQYHDAKIAGKVRLIVCFCSLEKKFISLCTCTFKKSVLQEYYLGYYNPENQDILTDSDGKQVLKVIENEHCFVIKILISINRYIIKQLMIKTYRC